VKKGDGVYRLSETIERMGGRPPQSLEEFVRQNADQFGGAPPEAPPPSPPT